MVSFPLHCNAYIRVLIVDVIVKDAVPEGLRTRVVYKFSSASCNACYVGETSRHFSTRVREHLLSDRSLNVFKHLQSSEFCRASCTPDCFEILDSAATKYQAKLKESMFIKWEKPDLNRQVKHINLTLSCKELSVTHLILF